MTKIESTRFKHPQFKRAMGTIVAIFYNNINSQGNFNYTSYQAFSHMIEKCLHEFGDHVFEYLENVVADDVRTEGGLLTTPYSLYRFFTNHRDEIANYPVQKKQKLIRQTIITDLIPHVEPTKRVVPNCFIRSALFGILELGAERKFLKNEKIISTPEYTIFFTGEELDQFDLKVWDSLVYLFKNKSLLQTKYTVNPNVTNLAEICRHVGISDAVKARPYIQQRIERLSRAHVKIIYNKMLFLGNLISSFKLDLTNGNYTVNFDKDLLAIFSENKDYSHIDFTIRKSLNQNQLALWLYSFCQSHVTDMHYPIYYLHELSRSRLIIPEFNRYLKKALQSLKNAYLSNGLNFDYKIQKKTVFIFLCTEQNQPSNDENIAHLL